MEWTAVKLDSVRFDSLTCHCCTIWRGSGAAGLGLCRPAADPFPATPGPLQGCRVCCGGAGVGVSLGGPGAARGCSQLGGGSGEVALGAGRWECCWGRGRLHLGRGSRSSLPSSVQPPRATAAGTANTQVDAVVWMDAGPAHCRPHRPRGRGVCLATVNAPRPSQSQSAHVLLTTLLYPIEKTHG